jgi:hypothetical protein
MKERLPSPQSLCLAFLLCIASTSQAFFNPNVGKWASRDPIQEDGSENLYGFVSNQPVQRVDVLGLLDWINEQPLPKYHRQFGGPPLRVGKRTLALDTLALTDGDISVDSKCAKDGKCWRLQKVTVRFAVNVYTFRAGVYRGMTPPVDPAWVDRAEGDHVTDFVAWADSYGTCLATSLEGALQLRTFTSKAYCESITRSTISAELYKSFLDAKLQSIAEHDDSGSHSHGNANQRP